MEQCLLVVLLFTSIILSVTTYLGNDIPIKYSDNYCIVLRQPNLWNDVIIVRRVSQKCSKTYAHNDAELTWISTSSVKTMCIELF